MLARLADAGALAFVRGHQAQLLQCQVDALGEGRAAAARKEPRIGQGRPPDHDRGTACFPLHEAGVAEGEHIAVADDGQGGGCDRAADPVPVGAALVFLHDRAGVDGHGLGAGVLAAAHHFEDVDLILVPAEARLDDDRNRHGFDGAFNGLVEPVEIAQIRRAAAFGDDLGYGTPEVDIHHLRPAPLKFPRPIGDEVDVVAVDLRGQQRDAGVGVDLRVGKVEHLEALARADADGAAVDKFDPDQPSAEAGAYQAENPVAHPGHRR